MLSSKDSPKISPINLLMFIVAWVWIGYAYIVGVESKSMFTHPIVPILLIALVIGMKEVESQTRAIIITITLIAGWLFVRLQNVFMPFIIGIVLAYIVHVCLDGLQKMSLPWYKRVQLEEYPAENQSWLKKTFHFIKSIRIYMHPIELPRSLAALLLTLIIIGGIAVFFFSAIPQIVEQSISMKDGIVHFYVNTLEPYVRGLYRDFQEGQYPSFIDSLPLFLKNAIKDLLKKVNTYITEQIPSLASATRKILTELLRRIYSGLTGTLGRISTAFFIIIIFVYTVQGFHIRLVKFKNLFPEQYQSYIVRYTTEIDANMRALLRGQLTVIIAISILSIIVYSIIGVPFAIIVGILAGICNLIPNVGPVLGGIIAIFALIVGLAAGEYRFSSFMIRFFFTVGGAFGIQFIDNSFITPRVMSSAIEVEPLMVIFAVLLFASLFGVWGAILAIPAIVVIKSVIKISQEIHLEQKESMSES